MQFFGNIALNNNEMQKMVLQTETEFPTVPVVGRIVFKQKRVWICVEYINGLPTWIPLTNELDMHLHVQSTSSNVWTIAHNMNTANPIVQIYDTDHSMIIPDKVVAIDNNTLQVELGVSSVGRAVIMFGSIVGADRREIIYSYTHLQTNLATTWVVDHGLGYEPIVRIMLNSGEEILPLSIVHNSKFKVTITFSGPYVGTARFI